MRRTKRPKEAKGGGAAQLCRADNHAMDSLCPDAREERRAVADLHAWPIGLDCGERIRLGEASQRIGHERASVKTAKTVISQLRVSKTYAPEQNGAKRFARRFGDSLVCVRHRLSDDGAMRHTTVELLVESTPVASRARSLVAIRIAANDKSTRILLMACGAEWQSKQKYWLLPRLVAKNLRLLRRVVPISA